MGDNSLPQWSPSSWTSRPVKQDVTYEDQTAFKAAIEKLERLPPLVTPQEIVRLKNSLKEVALGNAFLLQGGDCAELFDYCNQPMIEAKVKLMLQMSLVLIYGAKKKVVRVARMAGQFAKPRSSPMEVINGVEMPSFRGDNINGFAPTAETRKPNPSRLVDAYFHSAATLNYLRAALSSGLADLHSPLDWGLGHVVDPELKTRYQRIVDRITDTLDMMRTIGVNTGGGLETVDLFTSHEGLILEYEQAFTRLFKHPSNTFISETTKPIISLGQRKTSLPTRLHPAPATQGYYNTSAHFIWIGDRTRQLTNGHVEFFRGISNPIGVKVGPSMAPEEIPRILDILNPDREIGKVTLITRYGASKVAAHLPAHIEAVQKSGHIPVWQCDPMHGNGITAELSTSGEKIKTRRFADILSEVQQALEIHRRMGSYLGGVHLELTGEAVTECIGGAEGLTEEHLGSNYTTFCDPRLNEKQALELAFLVAGFYREDIVDGDGEGAGMSDSAIL